eukprot:COSAG01_NODE_2982_length_6754_cov_8.260556_3_plen_328_part_00
METHRGQATPEAGAAALAYGRLMGGNGLGHKAAARRAIVEALRTVAGLETVLAATGNPTGEFRAAGGGCLDAEHDTVLVRAPGGCSSRPRRPLRLVLTGCDLRPWVLGGDCAQGLKRALCSTGPMSNTGKVALCQGVAAAYARRHGADCEPALEALARAAHSTSNIDKDRARAEFEPLLPRMEAALVRPSPPPPLSLSLRTRPFVTGWEGGCAAAWRPGGCLTLCLSPACAAQGPTHKLVLDAKGRYGFLLHTKFQDYAAARPVEEAVVAGCAGLAPVVGRPLPPSPRPAITAPSPPVPVPGPCSASRPRSAPPLDRVRISAFAGRC